MKKLIGALALTAALSASAFAEVSFGGWLCTLPTLFGSNGDKTYAAGISNPWNWGARPARLDINWASDDGKAGMTMGVYNDMANGLGDADNAFMWIKPIDQLKIIVGKMEAGGGHIAGLRGDLCFGSWDWLRPSSTIVGEGFTFSGTPGNGLGLVVTPIDNLSIFALLPMTEGVMSNEAEDAFKNIKVGAGYKIGDIGTIKLQFLGDHAKEGDSEKTGAFEAGFDLTGIEKLFVTVGVKFNIANNDWYAASVKNGRTPQIEIPIGASYGITDTLKVSAVASAQIFNSDTKVNPHFMFGAGLNFAATDEINLVADFRFSMPYSVDGEKVDDSEAMSFMVGATYAVGSNASLGIAFQGMSHGGFADNTADGGNAMLSTDENKLAWAIPLRASVWF